MIIYLYDAIPNGQYAGSTISDTVFHSPVIIIVAQVWFESSL